MCICVYVNINLPTYVFIFYVFIYVCIDLFIYQHLPRQLTYDPDIYHHSFQLWFLEIPRSQVERPSKLPRLDDVPGWGDMAFQNWGYIGYRKMELSIGNWWWNMINHDCGGVVIFWTRPRFKVPCAFMCFGPLGTSKWSFMCSNFQFEFTKASDKSEKPQAVKPLDANEGFRSTELRNGLEWFQTSVAFFADLSFGFTSGSSGKSIYVIYEVAP